MWPLTFFFSGEVNPFKLSSSELELIKEIYLRLASSKEFESLIISRYF